MSRSAFILGVIAVVCVVESTCQFRIIHPTYRPPPSSRQPIIRTARAADNEPQPLWLNQGDDVIRAPSTGEHPFLPSIIDDVKLDTNTRYARSPSPDGSRTARAADNEPQPLWLYQGDDVIRAPSTGEHPFLPSIIDDVKLDTNTRYARSPSPDGSSSVYDDAQDSNARYTRSLGTPGHGRIGTNDKQGNSGSRGHDTGATHPGYNRRNARSLPSIGLPDYATTPPFNPKPWPGFPKPNSRTGF